MLFFSLFDDHFDRPRETQRHANVSNSHSLSLFIEMTLKPSKSILFNYSQRFKHRPQIHRSESPKIHVREKKIEK